METSGSRLRAARERHFETAAAAAKRHGWTYTTYVSHENGQTEVPVEAAKEYAKAFKVSAAWILLKQNSERDPNQELVEALRQKVKEIEDLLDKAS